MFSFNYFFLVNFDPTRLIQKLQTHFIMNHHELLTMIQSCQAILTFLVKTKWFYKMINLITVITGNVQLTSAENEGCSELDLFLKIQKSHCRSGSTSSSYGRFTSLIKKVCIATDQIGTSYRHHGTSEAPRHLLFENSTWQVEVRGWGKTIEIDESMFGHKRKYNHGRVSQGTWVFGMVERGTGRALAFGVPNRTRETLVPGLVQKFVEPGTYLRQVFTILQPEQYRLHTPRG